MFLWNAGAFECFHLSQLIDEILEGKKVLVSRKLSSLLGVYHARDDSSEGYVMTIEPSSRNQSDEPLGAVGVFTVIGHRDPAR